MSLAGERCARRVFWGAVDVAGSLSFLCLLLCGSEIIFPELGLLTLCVDILTGMALALARFGLGASVLFGCLLIVHGVCALLAGCPSRPNRPDVLRFASDHRNRVPTSIQFVRSLREVPGVDLIGVN